MELKWIDSHAHMVSEGLLENFESLKQNAIELGVGKVLIICGSLDQIEAAIKLTENDDMFDLAVGVHPTTVQERDEKEFLAMMEYLDHTKVVAVGEIGLDYYWDETYNDQQKEMLIRQIKIANEHALPIIVHLRKSCADVTEVLQKNPVDEKGVIHCFSEGPEEAKVFLDMGYYLGFGGIVTFKNGSNVREVLEMTPMNRILSETDSPYLAPVPKRGKKNEPAFVSYVGEFMTKEKGIEAHDMKEYIQDNYERLFKKTKRHSIN